MVAARFVIALALLSCVLSETFNSREDQRYASKSEQRFREYTRNSNLKMIQAHNSKKDAKYTLYPYEMFIHMTEKEIALAYLMNPKLLQLPRQVVLPNKTTSDRQVYSLPNMYLDWSQSGADGPVRNQGRCGSCYAFSAVSSIYHASKRATGYGTELSYQQIVDCSMDPRFRNYYNYGCQGGLPHRVFSYVQNNHISPNHYYPYTQETEYYGAVGACRTNNYRVVNFRIVESQIYYNSPLSQMINHLKTRVTSIGVSVVSSNFYYYRSGVLTDCGAPDAPINHAVALVGVHVNSAYGIAQWKLKNSWGARWGENGYIRISMHYNTCRVREYYSFPIARAM